MDVAGPDSCLSHYSFVILCRWQLKADSAQDSLLSCFQPCLANAALQAPPALWTLLLRTLSIPGTSRACSGQGHLCDSSVFNSRAANFIILPWIFRPSFHLQEDYSLVISFLFSLLSTKQCSNVIRRTPCHCLLCPQLHTTRQSWKVLNNFAFSFCLFIPLWSSSSWCSNQFISFSDRHCRHYIGG